MVPPLPDGRPRRHCHVRRRSGLGSVVRETLELGRNAGVETMKVNVAPVTVVVTAWAG